MSQSTVPPGADLSVADAGIPRPARRQPAVAVTGAGGFIGTHVTATLRTEGQRVIEVRRHGREAADLVIDDLGDPQRLADELQAANVATLVHAAWHGHPRSAGTDYPAQLKYSVGPTTNVMLASALAGIRQVVLVSSGGGLAGVIAHRVAPPAYGWAKRMAEQIALAHSETFGFDLTIIRPSAVYGPGQDPNSGLGAVTIFADRMLRDLPITVMGSDEAVRDFVHVRDVATAVSRALRAHQPGTFDLGGPESVSIRELIALLEKTIGKPARVEMVPATGVDPPKVQLDNGPFRSLTGWRPELRLSDTIGELVESLRARAEATPAQASGEDAGSAS